MTPATWVGLIAVGIPALVALYQVRRNTTTTQQVSDRSASLAEFVELRKAMREDLSDALTRIEALEKDVADERTLRQQAEERARAAEERADRAEKQVGELREDLNDALGRVAKLEAKLREHDIDPEGE